MNVPFPPLRFPGTSTLRIWGSWLLPPIWWLLQFQVRYALVPLACRDGARWMILAAGVIALLVALSLVRFACKRPPEAGQFPTLQRFISNVGIAISVLFVLTIAAQLLPDLFIDPCWQ